MKIHEAQTSIAAGPVFGIGGAHRFLTRAVQVHISGTGSVQLQGRSDLNAPRINLGSAFTADGVQFLQLMMQVRANLTAVSGSVDMLADA